MHAEHEELLHSYQPPPNTNYIHLYFKEADVEKAARFKVRFGHSPTPSLAELEEEDWNEMEEEEEEEEQEEEVVAVGDEEVEEEEAVVDDDDACWKRSRRRRRMVHEVIVLALGLALALSLSLALTEL